MNKFLLLIGLFSLSISAGAQVFVTLPVSFDSPVGYHDDYNTANQNFGNAAFIASFQIALVETSGWLKVSWDGLPVERILPSKCEFIQALSCVSGFRILGDLTTWYETIALDNVFIRNDRNNFLLDAFCN